MTTLSKDQHVTADNALPGRDLPIATADTHHVTGNPVKMDPPTGMKEVILGLGCFWGGQSANSGRRKA